MGHSAEARTEKACMGPAKTDALRSKQDWTAQKQRAAPIPVCAHHERFASHLRMRPRYLGPTGSGAQVVAMDRIRLMPANRGHRRRHQATVVALAGMLVVTSLLAGCIDLVFPQKEEEIEPATHGLLRIFAATRPGGIGSEFVHYNITFGGVGIAQDILLEDLRPMEMRTSTVDLVYMERERKAVEIARARLPDGEYPGFGFYISHASVAVERIIGSQDGRAVTQIQEQRIDHSGNIITPRALHVVFAGRVTDLYIEIDLQRSLQRGDSGMLRHTTVPAGITVLVDNQRVDWIPMDGGASRLPADDPTRRQIEDLRDRGIPPETSLIVEDADTGKRHYFDRAQPNKRINRAIGLGEDLAFDASRSVSNILRGDRTTGITDYIPIQQYHWDFGDGTTMSGARVTKNFTQGGLYDVTLTIRDEYDNTAQDHVTLFVPYRADQTVLTRTEKTTGTLAIGNSDTEAIPGLNTQQHSFTFPEDLEDGALNLGGYKVRLVAQDPLGGNLMGLQNTRLQVSSGHFQADETRFAPHELQTGGIPVWRGPLSAWVETEITVKVELVTGILADYELQVEAQYYHNLSRGLDPHDGHVHSQWPFGPRFDHLHWDGSARPAED